jgi:serine/threonine-protein kinase
MPEPTPLDDPFDLVGDVIDGQFRVDAVAGEGGLSVVYRGWHQSVAATVAIKCLNLPATLDPSLVEPFVQSFREGTKIQYRLSRGNLNIAQSLASGSTLAPRTGNLVPYLVREWLEGQSLASYFSERRSKKLGGLKLDEVIALLNGAADGLGFAHAQGVAHHAVNPSNLFVVETSGRPGVKILDFGLAKAASDPAVRMPGLRVLLPEYAAPEQIDRQLGEPGPWTDVYSLALITMEALLGAPVLVSKEGAPAAQIDPVLRPSARIAGLGLRLAVRDVLGRAVALEPKKRPATAGEFWSALKSAASPAPAPGASGELTKAPRPASPLSSPATGPMTQKPETIPRLPRPSSRKTMVGLGEEIAIVPEALAPVENLHPPPLPVTPTLPFPAVPGPFPTPTLSPVTPLSPAPTLAPAPALSPTPTPARALSPAPTLAPGIPSARASSPAMPPPLPSTVAEAASSTPISVPPPRTTSLSPPGIRKLRLLVVLSVAISSVVLLVLAMLTVYVVGVARRVARAPQNVASATIAATAPTPIPLPAPTAAPPTPSSAPILDSGVALRPTQRLVGAAAYAALSAIGNHLESCQRPGGHSGRGAAWVTFGRDGSVTHIKVGPPFAGTPEGKCLTDLFRVARVGPFLGPPGAVIYKFDLPAP